MEEKLRVQLIDIEMDMRLCQAPHQFKKSLHRCQQLLYDMDDLFQRKSLYYLVKSLFKCVDFAIDKCFDFHEKQPKKNEEKQEIEVKNITSSYSQISRILGGATIQGKNSGLDQPQNPKEQTPCRNCLLRQYALLQETEDDFFSTAYESDTVGLMNRITAQLNHIRQDPVERKSLAFAKQIENILGQFEIVQKKTLVFLQKQDMQLPVTSIEFNSDDNIKKFLQNILEQRTHWKQDASSKITGILNQTRQKLLALLKELQLQFQQMQKKSHGPPKNHKKQHRPQEHKETQTTEAEDSSMLLEDYYNKSILIENQAQRINQLEQMLYKGRYQLDDHNIQTAKVRQMSNFYKDQLQVLKGQFDQMEEKITNLDTENKIYKNKIDTINPENIEGIVEECAEEYSLQMRAAIKNAVDKVLEKMGVKNRQEPVLPARQSRRNQMSFISERRKSLMQQMSEARRSHQSNLQTDEDDRRSSQYRSIIQDTIIKEEKYEDRESDVTDEINSQKSDDFKGQLMEESQKQSIDRPMSQMQSKFMKKYSELKPRKESQTARDFNRLRESAFRFQKTEHSQESQSVKKSSNIEKSQQKSQKVVKISDKNSQKRTQKVISSEKLHKFPLKSPVVLQQTGINTEAIEKKEIKQVQTQTGFNPFAENYYEIIQNERTYAKGKENVEKSNKSKDPTYRIHRKTTGSKNDQFRLGTSIGSRRESKKRTEDLITIQSTHPKKQKTENKKHQTHSFLGMSPTQRLFQQKSLQTKSEFKTSSHSNNTSKKTLNFKDPISRKSSLQKLPPVKSTEINDFAQKIANDETLENIFQSDEFRSQLQLLLQGVKKNIPNNLNSQTASDAVRDAANMHFHKCGDYCKHLVRFMQKMKVLIEKQKKEQRKLLNIKLYNIEEIQVEEGQKSRTAIGGFRNKHV